MKTYSLDFLAWVDRCFFKDSFIRELRGLIIDEDVISVFRLSSLWQHRPGVLKFYQEYINSPDVTEAIETYLQQMQSQWDRIEDEKVVGPTTTTITNEMAYRLRFERGLKLPLGNTKYETPELRKIASREADLINELEALDQRIKEICKVDVFEELKVGCIVEVLTNMYSPTVGEGAMGTITISDPEANHYEVDFGDERLFIFRADQIVPVKDATPHFES